MSNIYELTAVEVPVARADRTVHLTYLIFCALPLALSFIMSTDGTLNSVHLFGLSVPIRMPCLFKYFTGLNCPACGMTRSFVSYVFIILGIFNKLQIYRFRYFYSYIPAADFIIILTAISGIILSIISMKKTGSKGQKGKGMALTGIIFSGAGLLVSITIIKLLINIIRYSY